MTSYNRISDIYKLDFVMTKILLMVSLDVISDMTNSNPFCDFTNLIWSHHFLDFGMSQLRICDLAKSFQFNAINK